MVYKKNGWYIASTVVTGLSVAVMAVTFILMGFGFDSAIIWFFAAIPFFVVGCLIRQSVKRKCEETIDGDEPESLFYNLRYAVYKIKKASQEKKLYIKIFKTVIAVVTASLAILLVIVAYYSFSKASLYRDPEYVANQTAYNEYYTRWIEARSSGDIELAHSCFETMEKYNNNNAIFRKRAGEYSKNRKPYLIACAAVFFADAVLASLYVSVIKLKKRKESES